MFILSLKEEVEESSVDFKDPDLCTYYRVCHKRNCTCEQYLAQKDDPSLWNNSLVLIYHPELILRNNLPTAPEIIGSTP